MAHEASHPSIRNPGPFEVSSGAKTAFLVLAAVGVAAFAFGLTSDPKRAWASLIHNHFYFMSLALGGVFFAAIQWLTGAMWSAPVRRISESFTSYLPFALVTFIVVLLGLKHIYVWTDEARVKADIVLSGKASYLSIGFFSIRNILALLLWIFFARQLVNNSIAQDAKGDYSYTLKNKVLAPIFLVVFALTFTMASFDQIMSLDPTWFSTMFGIYCFAGLFYANLASTCLLTLYLKSKGKLEGIVNDNHLHDLGKFMFAFTVFWAYIGFCQFMLIWYANMPEETGYFIHRFSDGWFPVSVFLLVGKFMTPFFLLLPRDSKRNPKVLKVVGCFMLVAQWIDILWLVQPEFFKEGPRIGIVEIGMTLGFAGVFLFFVSRFLSKNNVVAIGDPRLAESVFHHHQ